MTQQELTAESCGPNNDLDAISMDGVAAALRDVRKELKQLRDAVSGKVKSHYTVEEVATITGRAPYTVRQWIRTGRIDAKRIAGTGPKGRLLIPREQLEKLI